MTRRLRVAMVSIDLHGGAGVFARTLASGLRRYLDGQVEPALLLLRDRGRLPGDVEIWRQCEILRTNVSIDRRRWLEAPLHLLRLRGALNRLNPDLTLTIGTYANLLAPAALPRRPYVLTSHSHTSQLLGDSPFGGLIRRLIRLRYPRHVVVSPSEGVASDLRQRFGVRQPVVIPHGVDVDRIAALARSPAGDLPVPPGEPYLVAVGRLTAAKDYPTMLRAYAQARAACPTLRQPLVIVGGGEEEAALRSLAPSLGLFSGKHVHFLGHRDNPYPYMARAQLFMMSSAWEGFGLALVEAMALGVPCIATDCPSGPGEILAGGRFGRLVPPRNPRALAQAIIDVASSPQEREVLRRRAMERSREYTLQRMAHDYHDLFRRVLLHSNCTRD